MMTGTNAYSILVLNLIQNITGWATTAILIVLSAFLLFQELGWDK